MHFKVVQEGVKLATPTDQVAYIGLFLTGKVLKWFKPYLTKIQVNGIITANQDIWYMFTS